VKAFRSGGRIEAKPHGGGRHSPLLSHCDWLKAAVEEEPDITLMELCAGLLARGVKTSKSAVSRLLLKMGFSYKKRYWPADRTARTPAARVRWREGQASLDPQRLIFIDETAVPPI
jgi:transposase